LDSGSCLLSFVDSGLHDMVQICSIQGLNFVCKVG
jgi:hypothetical protein